MRWRLLAWAIVGVVVGAGGVGYALVRDGASAQTGLTATEERILQQFRVGAVQRDASDRRNPYANEPQAWRDAAHHYHDECSLCHGPSGHGDGPLGTKIFPRAPDLTAAATQRMSDGALHHIIAEGVRLTGMPAMGKDESDEEIWKLVALVRQLPQLDATAIEQAAAGHDADRDAQLRH